MASPLKYPRRLFKKVQLQETTRIALRRVLPVRKQATGVVTQQMSLLGQSVTETQKRPYRPFLR